MPKPGPEIVDTADGSHSLYSPHFNQQYHSQHGALQESIHVFLEAGLRPWLSETEPSNPIHVAEIGFGTGLNAYLTRLEAEKLQRPISYCGLEKFPIPAEQSRLLNYPKVLSGTEAAFFELHDCSWGIQHQLSTHFQFQKLAQDHLQASLPTNHFHTFFFDAFSPSTQPELWTKESLQIAYNALRPGGNLVTYCAKGDVKRSLKAIGFTLEKGLPGPAKKREMTRATKPLQ